MHPLLPHFRLHPLAHAAICLGLAMPLQAAWAQAPAQAVPFDIAAQPLGGALHELARQAGLQLALDLALVLGRQAPAVQGHRDVGAALESLLRGRLLVRHRPIQFGEAGRDPGQMMGDRCDILGEPGNHRPLRFGHAGHHRAEPLEFG